MSYTTVSDICVTRYMAQTGSCRGSTSPPPQRRVPPMITLPPRGSLDKFLEGLSPGPITFVSNFFTDHYPDTDVQSFSQLLADILPSPGTHNRPNHLLNHDSASNGQETMEGYKQIRAVELASTLQSPLEMLHPQALSHLPRYIIKPENGLSLSATSDEESRTTQASDHDDSHIESVDSFSYSQSGHLKPEPAGCVTMPASDGYIWRKYGQKQIKANELPRSYYKCAQVECPVTKKVGHSPDGNVSEIIYKGQHNHDPTTLCNRTKDGAANLNKRKFGKLEVGYVDQTSMPRVMITEPKVVVQMQSAVDVLDDGFKWRKYGQKVVKGNTYPRSYYRCTYAGCKVRKQVERAYSDPKSVVTTYEGKHKHDIPILAKPSSCKQTNYETELPILLEMKEEQLTT